MLFLQLKSCCAQPSCFISHLGAHDSPLLSCVPVSSTALTTVLVTFSPLGYNPWELNLKKRFILAPKFRRFCLELAGYKAGRAWWPNLVEERCREGREESGRERDPSRSQPRWPTSSHQAQPLNSTFLGYALWSRHFPEAPPLNPCASPKLGTI